METIILSVFAIIFGVMSIWEALFSKKAKGFTQDRIMYFIIVQLCVLYQAVFFGPNPTLVGNLVFCFILLISMMIIYVYVIGYRVSFKAMTQSIVEEKLKEALTENNIKYTVDDSKVTYKIIIKKYFCRVCIQSMNWNTKKRVVAFKGWLNYKSCGKIRNSLIEKLENEVIVKRSDVIEDILLATVGFGFIGMGVWMLVSKGFI